MSIKKGFPPMVILLLLISCIFLAGCVPRARIAITEKPQVIATLFPQYDFVREIAGDLVDVLLLIPPGVEPHSYEPSPRDIVDVQKASMFVYTGEHMEPWARRIIETAQGTPLLIVDSSHGVLLMDQGDDHHHHDDDHDDHDDHGDGRVDPHIWLDPLNAQIMVDNIVTGLRQVDPANANIYTQNGEAYKERLQALDARFLEAFAQTGSKHILYAGHFTFGYFAARYGLEHSSPYSGFAPDAEPTPQRIAELIKNVQGASNKVVYYEELVDPKVARVIVEQTGAKMILLHGVHNVSKEEISSGVTYLSLMEDNLHKLVEGLTGQ